MERRLQRGRLACRRRQRLVDQQLHRLSRLVAGGVDRFHAQLVQTRSEGEIGSVGGAGDQRERGVHLIVDVQHGLGYAHVVGELGGQAIQCKSGHAFIKERMRDEDAVYGGEMSAHHYFRDFSYADSGMIPWLLVTGIMSSSGRTLSELVSARMQRYPVSGEINREVADARQTLEKIREHYGPTAQKIDETDGYGFEYPDWRFNLRMSNTEPVIRLNVESRGDYALMEKKTEEILALL